MVKVLILFWAVLLSAHAVMAKTYFVSVSGSDTNTGLSVENPFKSIPKAINLVVSGDQIFVRAGAYAYSSAINLSSSGTKLAPIRLEGYSDERPLINFSGSATGVYGFVLSGSYWYVKGLDVCKTGKNGMLIKGAYNTIEFCTFFENRDSGLQLSNGAHDNQIINCDSYYNADPAANYANADGFACKMAVGTNNYFYGCRSWYNCDDGWDGYLRGADNVSTVLENCWTWKNGYLKNGTDPGSQANGNGFKMGGSDDKTLKHNFTLKNCVAFDNKAKGFDQNNSKGNLILYNCSGFRNGGNNYSIPSALATGKIAEVKNCLSADNKISLGTFVTQVANSWMAPLSVTNDDFASLDTTGISGPRKPDGSLPDVAFIHLAKGSDLIDKGTDIGLPFKGALPDLGAFETDYTTTSLLIPKSEDEFTTCFSHGELIINLKEPGKQASHFSLFRLNGRMAFCSKMEPFAQVQKFDCTHLPSGIYILRISSNFRQWQSQKLIKLE